jgi:type IV secretory pathway TraG/TraD family ATPase VirD4
MELVNSFFDEKIRRSNAPFFPMAAKDILYGIMMYIIRRTERSVRTNEELYLYLRDASLDDVINSFSEMDDLKGLLDYIYNSSGMTEQSQGVYSELRSVANELFIENFKKTGEFSIRSFIRNKGARILFIEYDLGVGSVLTPIYKTMLDLAIKETLSRSHTEGNVYFVIDEFSLLPHLYHIADGVNFGRSLGAKFIVAIQNCQQIIEAYGEQNAYSILSAFGTLVSFRSTDASTIRFVQDHYGIARTGVKYKTHDYRAGEQTAFITGRAVEDWEILKLKKGEALVSISEYDPSPVKFKFKEIS